MLKIRLQGTEKDIEWFLNILEYDSRISVHNPSDPLDIKGTRKYKRLYLEVLRNIDEEMKK
ncbi:MAG: hypothetical protein IK078_09315 [Lachnospiraceae bacterium]|nr:hypothetical protein [Lachnospiraceae bacterium]